MISSFKLRFQSCVIILLLLAFADTNTAQESVKHLGKDIYLADPTIFYDAGIYYLYGTVGGSPDNGFLVYTSSDMKSWQGPAGKKNGYALQKGDVFGSSRFWAPQVFRYKNKFYMAYAADENISIAESDSPLGPFTQYKKQALAAPVKQIDPFVFIDADGKKYLYHVRLEKGNRIFVAELTDDFSEIKKETLKECISATEPWENTSNAGWPVTEGPSVLKHNNLYYLVYTANDFRNPDYAVGYAVSKSPSGPWKKSVNNPVLSKKDVGKNGTGHGDFIKGDKGNLFYVFHTHFSDTTVAPRKTAIVKAGFIEENTGEDQLVMDKLSFYYPQLE